MIVPKKIRNTIRKYRPHFAAVASFTLADIEQQMVWCKRDLDEFDDKYCLALAAGRMNDCRIWKRHLAEARNRYVTLIRRRTQLLNRASA